MITTVIIRRQGAQSNSTHVARMATKGSGYRICVGTRAGDRQCLPSLNGRPSAYPGNLPAIHTPIRRPLSADTGVLIAASRLIALRFKFFGAFTALRAVFSSLHGARALFQSSARRVADVFHSVSLLLSMPMKVSKGSGNGTKNLFQIRQKSFRE